MQDRARQSGSAPMRPGACVSRIPQAMPPGEAHLTPPPATGWRLAMLSFLGSPVRCGIMPALLGLCMAVPLQAKTLRLQHGAVTPFTPGGYTGISDATIDSGATDQNFGGEWEFQIGGMGQGAVRRGLMRWDVRALAPLFNDPRYEVIAVELRLGLWYNWKIFDQTFDVYRILPANAGWVEGASQGDTTPGLVTWDALAHGQRPWAGSAGCGTPGEDTDPAPLLSLQADRLTHMLPRYLPPVELPLLIVQDWALHPERNAGLLIRRREEPTTGGEQYVFFISSQHQRQDHGWDRHHPELIITFIDREDQGVSRPGEIVSAGQSGYVVVIPDVPVGSERYAAEECVSHIKMMSGCELTVVHERHYREELGHPISIGRTEMSRRILDDEGLRELGDEGYVVHPEASALTIVGGRRRGSLYGVYALLEQFGVRWLTPKVTRYPTVSTVLTPPATLRFVPPVFYRDQLWNNGSDAIWRARMRLNGEYARILEEMGGSCRVLLGCHSYHALVPTGLFADHPDWFAEKEDGERHAGIDHSVELCTTNPELRTFILQRVLRDLRENPDVEQYWVSQDDGRLSGCFCARCRAERQRHGGKVVAPGEVDASDPVAVASRLKDCRWSANTIGLANAIACGIRDEFPRVQIKTLAYSYTWPAPDMTVEPNVVVVICGPAGDWFLPYKDNDLTRDWRQALRQWTGLGGAVQTYMYGGSNYGYWWPFPTWYTMCRNQQTAFEDGVRAMYRQGTAAGYGAEFTELRAYLSARMSFNPERDLMTEVREFTDGYYGAGGESIRGYMTWFDAYLRQHQVHGDHYWGNNRGWAEYMTPELTETADTFFREALQRTAGSPEIELRVRAARLPILLMRALFGVRPTPLITDTEILLVDETRRDSVIAAAREFGETMRACGYDRWNELTAYDPDHNPLSAYAQPHPLVCLQNSQSRLFIAPSLGGRIVRWDITAFAENIMHLPDTTVQNYPYGGGYEETSQFERTSPGPMADFQAIGIPGSDQVTLRAVLSNGVEVVRALGLAADGCQLTIHSTFTNRADQPVMVTPRSHPEFSLSRLRNCALRYTDQAGQVTTRDLLAPGRSTGDIVLPIEAVSGREWELTNRDDDWALVHQFDPAQVATLYCFYGETFGCMTLELWGKPVELGPGEAVELTQAFTVRPPDRHP